MNLEGDIVTFFSDSSRLTRIDRLNWLLFKCLKDVETGLDQDIKATMNDIGMRYEKTWKRRDEAPPDQLKYRHIGFVPVKASSKWPGDLWVHFGWEGEKGRLLNGNNPWIGIYTRTTNDTVYESIAQAGRAVLSNSQENKFGVGEPYPIFEEAPQWPVIDWDGSSIRCTTRLIGLKNVIPDRGENIVKWIRDRITKLLDKFAQGE